MDSSCSSDSFPDIGQPGTSTDSSIHSKDGSMICLRADKSQLLSHFECCVCYDIISPPILQCPNAHVFCQTCLNKFEPPYTCPTCREPLPPKPIRNLPMEKIAASLGLPFPCKYKICGCRSSSTLTEKTLHESLCEFRPFNCPSIWGRCHWLGDRDQVFEHLVREHKYKNQALHQLKDSPNIVRSDFYYNLKYNLVEMKVANWTKLLTFKNYEFFFVLSRKCSIAMEMNFKAILFFIGEQRIANRFRYRLEIGDESDGPRIQFEDTPNSIRNGVPLTVSAGMGLAFDNQVAERFIDDNIFRIIFELREVSC